MVAKRSGHQSSISLPSAPLLKRQHSLVSKPIFSSNHFTSSDRRRSGYDVTTSSVARSDTPDWDHHQCAGDPGPAAVVLDGYVVGGQHHRGGDRVVDDDLRENAAGIQHLSRRCLLATTLGRLVLNVASTRLILTRARAKGLSAAGEVITGVLASLWPATRSSLA